MSSGRAQDISLSSIVAETCMTYDRGAEGYAFSTASFDAYPGLKEELLSFIRSLPPGGAVLDLGSGGGRDAELIALHGRPVIAGDISANMLAQVRKRVLPPHDSLLRLTRLTMTSLPFRDGSLGGVWACGSILHIPRKEIRTVLGEILRVLMPGGSTAISMREGAGEGWRTGGSLPGRRWFTHVQPDDFRTMMTQEGFQLVDVRYRGRPGWYVVTGRRPG